MSSDEESFSGDEKETLASYEKRKLNEINEIEQEIDIIFKKSKNEENLRLAEGADLLCLRVNEGVVGEALDDIEKLITDSSNIEDGLKACKLVAEEASQKTARSYVFTNYDIVKPEEYKWKEMGFVRYAVWQLERCPKTQKLHHQGYVECTKPIRFAALKKHFPNGGKKAWFGIRRATNRQARAYCMKMTSREVSDPKITGPFEWGFFDDKAPVGKTGNREQQVKELISLLNEGKDRDWLLLNDKAHYVQDFHHVLTSYEKMKERNNVISFKHNRVYTVVLQGEQGTGKTSNIIDLLSPLGNKCVSKITQSL